MFGSEVLDVAIGLTLVFLLMSLILTSVVEAIEAVLKTRAVDLENAILQLLQGDAAALRALYEHPVIYAYYRGGYPPPPANALAANARAGAGPGSGLRRMGRGLPSYVPREAFTTAFLDLWRKGTFGNPDVAAAMQTIEAAAGSDAAALRTSIEAWYDGAMDRAAGWFKRRTQRRLFILGLLIALVLNVNAIVIAEHLSISDEARRIAVQVAERTVVAESVTADPESDGGALGEADGAGTDLDAGAAVDETPAASGAPGQAEPGMPSSLVGDDNLRAFDQQVRSIGLPIGWNDFAAHRVASGFPETCGWNDPRKCSVSGGTTFRWWRAALLLAIGYLITAFAVMLGAPFWFDVLNKIMVVRATVKPREKSPDEASEDRSPSRLPTTPANERGTGGGAVSGGTTGSADDDGAVG